MPDSNQKTSQHLNDINQEFKEKEVQKRAADLGMPYINLLDFKVNPDVLSLLHEEESQIAHMVVFFQVGKKIRIAVGDPENIHAKQLIQKFKTEHFIVNINLASEESILKVQQLYETSFYKKEEEEEITIENEEKIATEALEEFEKDTEKDLSKKKSSDALSDIHALAVQMHVSDVHFQQEKNEVKVRFRIDGILQGITSLDSKAYEGIIRQIKMNAGLKLNIMTKPQDGQYIFAVNERNIDVRVSVLPSVYGESIVLRFLDPKKGLVSLADLGFKKYSLEKVATALSKPEGIILLTGPTGSGKTTTLYSMLDVLNKPQRKIVTLEDPVEYQIPGIVQCSVHEDEEDNLNYEEGLKSILRQDPDVIMLGEIREPKVAKTAIQAAMTGHLVLSTLHSNSSIESFARLKDLEVSDYLLIPAINAIIAQRLVRKVCQYCKEERKRSEKDISLITPIVKKLRSQGMSISEVSGNEVHAKGCKLCNHSGYLGRLTIAEVLVISDALKDALRASKDEKELYKYAVSEGFVSMREDGILKVLDGLTTLEEVLRVTG
ncbi:type II/IV secretion system protein [Candidatus Peregrinibacteria bacterium]|jgi:type IV pilus assembly protein PilB|nr:type II/IV secretion system protein [Candidatus Peregrinibacteria bacterium]